LAVVNAMVPWRRRHIIRWRSGFTHCQGRESEIGLLFGYLMNNLLAQPTEKMTMVYWEHLLSFCGGWCQVLRYQDVTALVISIKRLALNS